MPRFEINSPDGRRFEIDAPEGATLDDAIAYAQANFQAKKSEPIKATDGMTGGEKFMAGMGKGFVDLGRGAKQTALATLDAYARPFTDKPQTRATDYQGEIDAARKMDAPLMDTGAGMAGNIAGNVAAFIPAALIPGANTVAGAAAMGGVSGLLQPTAADESRLTNALIGGAVGGGAQAGIGKLAQMAGSRLASKGASEATRASQNSVRDATLRASQDAGYLVPPDQAGAGIVPRVLQGVSGKIKTNQAMAVKNQTLTDTLARRAVGLPDDAPITADALKSIRKDAYERGYAPLARAGRLETDSAYNAALDNIVGRYRGAAQDFPGVASDDVTKFVNGPKATGGIPDRSAWMDDAGNMLDNFVEPQAPKDMRNLLQELKKDGGILPSEVDEIGVGNIHKARPGLLNKRDGKSADSMLEWMREHGWLNSRMIADAEEMPGGAQELAKDFVRSALAGDRVIHPSQEGAWYAYNQAMQDIADSGIKKVTIPGKAAEQLGGMRVKDFDAGNAVQMTQILRDEASDAFRVGNSSLGKAKREAAKAIEDQIERSLSKAGKNGQEALKSFREARKLMAKSHDVERALIAEGGQVNAKVLGAALQRGKPLTDELRTIGAFANNFRDVAGIPQSGWGSPLTALDAFGAAGMAGMGAGPATIALPAARLGARGLLTNQSFQKSQIGPKYGPGLLDNMTPKMLEELERMGMGGLLGAGYSGR